MSLRAVGEVTPSLPGNPWYHPPEHTCLGGQCQEVCVQDKCASGASVSCLSNGIRFLPLRLRRPQTAAPLSARIFIFFTMILAACTPASPTAETGPTPTAVIAGKTVTPPPDEQGQVKPTIVPFRFVLPTPGAEPVSGWRPPLYPVPWAVSAYDHFYFARPIAADNVNWPLAEYRYGGVFFAPNIVHTGVDIDAVEGAPILAAGPGTVVSADWGLFSAVPGNITDPYGMAVVVHHDFGYKDQPLYTVYAHMSEIIAVVGQHVETGDVLGLVGDTGVTTGPHLHFEVRLGDNTFFSTYNPELWTAPP